MSGITTHVLDTSIGRPASEIPLLLESSSDGREWRKLGEATTDSDGRARQILPAGGTLAAGTYRLSFETAAYFARRGLKGFYPRVSIEFQIEDPAQHFHVPLLLSPFGYSTYRGS